MLYREGLAGVEVAVREGHPAVPPASARILRGHSAVATGAKLFKNKYKKIAKSRYYF